MAAKHRSAAPGLRSALAIVLTALSFGVLADGYQMHYKVAGLSTPKPKVTFTSHTFTTCGNTGQSGPGISRCQTAYADAEILKPEYSFTVVSGVQRWAIPATGKYRIEAYGASGSGGNGGGIGGRGARVSGEFNLQAGQMVRVLVGQQGINMGGYTTDGASGGGGGASYVVLGESGTQDEQVLVIAAGGGGGNDRNYQGYLSGLDGNAGTSGTGNEANNGGSFRSGGAGQQGAGFASGAGGGYYSRSGNTALGGFGGGGTADDSRSGGGGWVGGTTSTPAYSRNNGANPSGTTGANEGHGRVIIELLK